MFMYLGQVCKHGCEKRAEKIVVFPYVCSWALSDNSELLGINLVFLSQHMRPAPRDTMQLTMQRKGVVDSACVCL